MKLAVVIPAYNEGENIGPTIVELQQQLATIEVITDTQIIVVDDHSTDETFSVVKKLDDPAVRCLRLSRRSGSHVALRAGLAHSDADAVLCIAADGQDCPEAIAKMLEKQQRGGQLIWALRRARKNEPKLLKLASLAFYRMLSMLAGSHGQGIDLSRADFFLLDRIVVAAIEACPERNTSLFGMLAWIGFRQEYVEYERRPRRAGRSKWNFRARMRLAADWIIAFSNVPLRIVTATGTAIALLGLGLAVWMAVRAIAGWEVISWLPLMAAVLVVGGIQIAVLGVVGAYLWRALDEARRRSLYFIERSTVEEPQGEPD